jgi:hypothetical protein
VRPRQERTREDLVLLGAMGRAYAAGRQYAAAGDLLRETVEGWFDAEDVPGASHSLCEYLRVLGISRDAGAIEGAMTRFVTRFETEIADDPVSAAFVKLALGRAWAQVGRPAEAIEALGDATASWRRAPQHVIFSRLRWLARALRAAGRTDEAGARLAELGKASDGRPVGTPFLLLGQLDEAIASSDPASIAHGLARLLEEARKERTSWGHSVVRLDAQVAAGDSVTRARSIADEFGY